MQIIVKEIFCIIQGLLQNIIKYLPYEQVVKLELVSIYRNKFLKKVNLFSQKN